MRQTREAMVRTMGVKMQAKRPSLPILTVVVCVIQSSNAVEGGQS